MLTTAPCPIASVGRSASTTSASASSVVLSNVTAGPLGATKPGVMPTEVTTPSTGARRT